LPLQSLAVLGQLLQIDREKIGFSNSAVIKRPVLEPYGVELLLAGVPPFAIVDSTYVLTGLYQSPCFSVMVQQPFHLSSRNEG
jgi:hypothetical protein